MYRPAYQGIRYCTNIIKRTELIDKARKRLNCRTAKVTLLLNRAYLPFIPVIYCAVPMRFSYIIQLAISIVMKHRKKETSKKFRQIFLVAYV